MDYHEYRERIHNRPRKVLEEFDRRVRESLRIDHGFQGSWSYEDYVRRIPWGEQKALQRKLAKKEATAASAAAAAAASSAAVVFDDDLSDSDDESDDELDEDVFEFEWNGATYWRSPGGHVMEEEDGPIVGRWDEDEQVVQFDD